jgi:hypothetical protein
MKKMQSFSPGLGATEYSLMNSTSTAGANHIT